MMSVLMPSPTLKEPMLLRTVSAMDIVNNAANSLENIIDGFQHPIDVIDFY